jgi:enterobacteria phage integrase
MNRRRSKSKAGFPRNLYENDGYFSWRNPLTDETFGLGRNRAQAFEEALEANLKIAKPRVRLVDRISGDNKRTVEAWEAKYQEILKKHPLTPATRANYLTFSRRMVKMLGAQKPIITVSALHVSEGLDALVNEGLAGVAKSVRQYMKHSFAEAIVQGWRAIGDNPVVDTRITSPPKVARARLTLDVFMRVYEPSQGWFRNAIGLALTGGQRLEDIGAAKFKDFREGYWWIKQASKKTDDPHLIRIPLDLKPEGFHLSLGEVVSQSKRGAVLSSFVVHQTERRRGRSVLGREIRPSTISSSFTDAVQALGIDWGDKTPPTFHEIRSLSARLYGAQGVNTQVLLGHSRAETTAIYLNSRGQEWSTVGTV